MPYYTDEHEAAVIAALTPSDGDIRQAKSAILEDLAGGQIRPLAQLLQSVGPVAMQDPRREYVDAVLLDDPEQTRRHPMIETRRIYLAAVHAIVDLETAGLIVAHERLDGGGGWDGRFGPLRSLPFRYRSGSTSIQLNRVAVPVPRGPAYRLHRALLDHPQQAHVLDPELLVDGLDLPVRVVRAVREATAAYRRGLPLAAANLLGALVEGAWFHAARQLAPSVPAIATALDRDPFPSIADVQRRTIDALRSGQPHRADDLTAVAGLIREIRNYATHVDSDHDQDLDGWLDDTGVITLFGTVRRHLVGLMTAVDHATQPQGASAATTRRST